MNNPKKYHVLMTQDLWFYIHEDEGLCGVWTKLDGGVRLDKSCLFCCSASQSFVEFELDWRNDIMFGLMEIKGFETFEEVVEYLNDLLFYAELKK